MGSLPLKFAGEMAGLLLAKVNTCMTQLRSEKRSALAEVGFLICSCFVKGICKYSKIFAVPFSFVIMIERIRSILIILIDKAKVVKEKILMFQSKNEFWKQKTSVNIWIIPNPVSFSRLIILGNEYE